MMPEKICPRLEANIFFSLGPYIHMSAITKELKMEGFIVTRYTSKYPEGIKDMRQWISEVGYF